MFKEPKQESKADHLYHSGWGTTQKGANADAKVLQEQMAKQGVDTKVTGFAAPLPHQIFGHWLGFQSKASKQLGDRIATNVENDIPTHVHGHSQGTGQGKMAIEHAIEKSKPPVSKEMKTAAEQKYPTGSHEW